MEKIRRLNPFNLNTGWKSVDASNFRASKLKQDTCRCSLIDRSFNTENTKEVTAEKTAENIGKKRLSKKKHPKLSLAFTLAATVKDELSCNAEDFTSEKNQTALNLKCGTTTTLSPEQRRLVREAWHRAIKKKGDAGLWIFQRLFLLYPQLKTVFGLQAVPHEKLEQNELFIRHAKILSDVIEMVVDSTDALDDVLGPLLVSYGGKHAHFDRPPSTHGPGGFKPEHWDLFAGTMQEYATHSWRNNEATLRAWTILVRFLVGKVKQGYFVEKASMVPTENIAAQKLKKFENSLDKM